MIRIGNDGSDRLKRNRTHPKTLSELQVPGTLGYQGIRVSGKAGEIMLVLFRYFGSLPMAKVPGILWQGSFFLWIPEAPLNISVIDEPANGLSMD